MIIDRSRLWSNKQAAKQFLLSSAGVLLHELGHHAAANEVGVTAGHVLLEVNDCETASGRFVIADHYLSKLSVDQCAFISAAGALAELYFCDLTKPERLRGDIAAYESLLAWKDPRLTSASLLGMWREQYSKRFAKLANVVESNFDTCLRLCNHGDFVLDAVHVIPTSMLSTPFARSQEELGLEIKQTAPLSPRQRARWVFGKAVGPI